MNRERARELLPIIQAFAEGKDVQFRNPVGMVGSDWIDDDEMSHFEIYEYRIKPEPREFWIQIQKSYDGNEKITGSGWIDKGDPTPEATGKMSTIIKVREVIE